MESILSELPPTEPLVYTIAGCSEHSSRYVAENILVDEPENQSSRWSGLHQDPHAKQWILLRLDRPAVIQSITFGKFHRSHPCNLKEFKISVGMSANEMVEVLHSSLKDDSTPETFQLRHMKNTGIYLPSNFLKIAPLTAHGTSYHISIWYVSIHGLRDEVFVKTITLKHDEYREAIALRYILKHLRARRLLAPYRALLSISDMRFEHPLVTQLYESLVTEGNWTEAESVILAAAEAGLFDAYIQSCQTRAEWKHLHAADDGGDCPSRRGGHAMCIDEGTGLIYLFGGWDGRNSLDDFWVYSIADNRWRCINEHASTNSGGPGPRSCHRMVFDQKTGYIYLLGKLSDSDGDSEDFANTSTGSDHTRHSSSDTASQEYPAEFYRYHTYGPIAGTWELLSSDTAAQGGPLLIFDHQMAIDSAAQVLYVCGGRIYGGSSGTVKYSGLYSYEVSANRWTLLEPRGPTGTLCPDISQRFGHCMVFEPNGRSLYIFAGMQDGDHYFSDMYIYDTESNTFSQIFANFTAAGGPDRTFTQRAVIDPSLQEIYVLCGLTRGRSAPFPRLDGTNWLYRYDEQPGKWSRILNGAVISDENTVSQPRTRYGHQIVYDSRSRTIYLHGGNAGRVSEIGNSSEYADDGAGAVEFRLDDLWSMTLNRLKPEEAMRKAKFDIRCQQFREMCDNVPAVTALKFLQDEIADVVDHGSSEADIFQSLLAHLLTRSSSESSEPSSRVPSKAIFEARTRIFENLLEFFPADAKEPSSSVVDMIDWYEESTHD